MINYSTKRNSMACLLFIVVLVQCKQPQSPVNKCPAYIYDSAKVMEMYKLEDYKNQDPSDSTIELYYFNKSFEDSAGGVNFYRKGYTLLHYTKYYLHSREFRDTSFTKHRSYLDSISYFDSNWLANQEKLDSFWQPVNCWRCGSFYDTLRTYMILPVENTDSITFLQVHRWYFQTSN